MGSNRSLWRLIHYGDYVSRTQYESISNPNSHSAYNEDYTFDGADPQGVTTMGPAARSQFQISATNGNTKGMLYHPDNPMSIFGEGTEGSKPSGFGHMGMMKPLVSGILNNPAPYSCSFFPDWPAAGEAMLQTFEPEAYTVWHEPHYGAHSDSNWSNSANDYGVNSAQSYGNNDYCLTLPIRGGWWKDSGSGYGWTNVNAETRPGYGAYMISYGANQNQQHYKKGWDAMQDYKIIVPAMPGEVFTVKVYAKHMTPLCTKCASSQSMAGHIYSASLADQGHWDEFEMPGMSYGGRGWHSWATQSHWQRWGQPDDADHLNYPQTGSNAHNGLPTYKMHIGGNIDNRTGRVSSSMDMFVTTQTVKGIVFRPQRPRIKMFAFSCDHNGKTSGQGHMTLGLSGSHSSYMEIPHGGNWKCGKKHSEDGGSPDIDYLDDVVNEDGIRIESSSLEGATWFFTERILDQPNTWYELSMTCKIDPLAHWVRGIQLRLDSPYPKNNYDNGRPYDDKVQKKVAQYPDTNNEWVHGVGYLDINGYPVGDRVLGKQAIGFMMPHDDPHYLYVDEKSTTNTSTPYRFNFVNSYYSTSFHNSNAWPEPDNHFITRGFATREDHITNKFITQYGGIYTDNWGVWKNDISLGRYVPARWLGGTFTCGQNQYYVVQPYVGGGTSYEYSDLGNGTQNGLTLNCTGYPTLSNGKLRAYIECYVNIDNAETGSDGHANFAPERFEVTCGQNNKEGFIVTINPPQDVNVPGSGSNAHSAVSPGEWRVGENFLRIYIGDAIWWDTAGDVETGTYSNSYNFNRLEIYRNDNGDYGGTDNSDKFFTIRDFRIVPAEGYSFDDSNDFSDAWGSGKSLGIPADNQDT